MSLILGGTSQSSIVLKTDARLWPVAMLDMEVAESFRSPWWPRGGMLLGDQSIDVGVLESAPYELPEITRGISSRLGFVGITRDVYGSPLGACTVRTFRTSDGALGHETVSDADGNFVACAYDGLAYFLVFYKAGTPDICGTTVNTLIGS